MNKTYDQVFDGCLIKPRGIVYVTGPSGVGKSLFSIGLIESGLDPKRITVFDNESSLQQHHESMPGGLFGHYYNMTEIRIREKGLFGTPADLVDMVHSRVEQLPDGETDVIVLDNAVPFEDAIQALVETRPEEFGYTRGQIEGMSAVKWGPIKKTYSSFLQLISDGRKAKLAFVTTQLSQAFAGKQPMPGVYKPQGKADILTQAATMRLWLLPSGNPVPDALILKSRMVYPKHTGDSIQWQEVLPKKLSPATWPHIIEYLKKPPAKVPANEVPTALEMAILRGTMTPDQLKLYRMLVQSSISPDAEGEEGLAETKPGKSTSKAPSNVAEFIVAVT